MAASALCNFLSCTLPSHRLPIKKPRTHLIFSSSSSSSRSFQSGIYGDGLVPVVENEPYSSYSSDLVSVVCPSLLYTNTLFFKSAYNVQVIVGEDESEEVLLRRFRREVMKAGVILESKRRRFFENKQDEKKRKTREAAKRNSRRRRPFTPRTPPPEKQDSLKNKKDEDEEEDNWELVEGDLPY
ncbi:30S ribosomal protein S21, chloroplastic-like isoform X2 [Telopea speciosissima]|uniref:30S ribosomal protein S21, chloroplastic-like isoform X2 n=1 Tax=Telopea speciosissima TaxID=54955 RepID=UPI001CC54F65|nr:30S ribosomal protein S21, chloroplastic-like isoform X2 [Telopea speciosissima]